MTLRPVPSTPARERRNESRTRSERPTNGSSTATAIPIDSLSAPQTLTVSGRPDAPARERRRRPSAATRNGPDRLALWAVVLGLLLAIVAATTARGDDPRPAVPDSAPSAQVDR